MEKDKEIDYLYALIKAKENVIKVLQMQNLDLYNKLQKYEKKRKVKLYE